MVSENLDENLCSFCFFCGEEFNMFQFDAHECRDTNTDDGNKSTEAVDSTEGKEHNLPTPKTIDLTEDTNRYEPLYRTSTSKSRENSVAKNNDLVSEHSSRKKAKTQKKASKSFASFTQNSSKNYIPTTSHSLGDDSTQKPRSNLIQNLSAVSCSSKKTSETVVASTEKSQSIPTSSKFWNKMVGTSEASSEAGIKASEMPTINENMTANPVVLSKDETSCDNNSRNNAKNDENDTSFLDIDNSILSNVNRLSEQLKLIFCEFCGTKRTNDMELKQHHEFAHDKQSFSCFICGEPFFDTCELIFHYNIKHYKSDANKAEMDSLKLTPNSSRRTHRYYCSQCGNGFNLIHLLLSHKEKMIKKGLHVLEDGLKSSRIFFSKGPTLVDSIKFKKRKKSSTISSSSAKKTKPDAIQKKLMTESESSILTENNSASSDVQNIAFETDNKNIKDVLRDDKDEHAVIKDIASIEKQNIDNSKNDIMENSGFGTTLDEYSLYYNKLPEKNNREEIRVQIPLDKIIITKEILEIAPEANSRYSTSDANEIMKTKDPTRTDSSSNIVVEMKGSRIETETLLKKNENKSKHEVFLDRGEKLSNSTILDPFHRRINSQYTEKSTESYTETSDEGKNTSPITDIIKKTHAFLKTQENNITDTSGMPKKNSSVEINYNDNKHKLNQVREHPNIVSPSIQMLNEAEQFAANQHSCHTTDVIALEQTRLDAEPLSPRTLTGDINIEPMNYPDWNVSSNTPILPYTEEEMAIIEEACQKIQELNQKENTDEGDTLPDFAEFDPESSQRMTTQIFCEACGHPCRNSQELEIHKTSMHPGFYFICFVCDQHFKTVDTLITHQKKYPISILTMNESQFLRLRKISPNKSYPYYCNKCGKGFTLIGLIAKHKTLDHQIIESDNENKRTHLKESLREKSKATTKQNVVEKSDRSQTDNYSKPAKINTNSHLDFTCGRENVQKKYQKDKDYSENLNHLGPPLMNVDFQASNECSLNTSLSEHVLDSFSYNRNTEFDRSKSFINQEIKFTNCESMEHEQTKIRFKITENDKKVTESMEKNWKNVNDTTCDNLNDVNKPYTHFKEDSLSRKAQMQPYKPLNNSFSEDLISVADQSPNLNKPKDKISETLVLLDDADSNSNNSSGTHEDSMKTDFSNFIDVDEFIKKKGITNQAEKECSILDVPDKHFRGDSHLHKTRTLPYLPLLNLNNSSSEDFISIADESANLKKSKEKLSEILVSSNEADLVSNNLKNSTGTKEKSINTKLSNSVDVEEFIEKEGISNQADRECAILNVPDDKHSKEDSLVHKVQTLPNVCANFDKPKDKISEILVSSDDADSNSNNSSGTHEDSMITDFSNFIDVDEFIKEKGITNQAEKECSILDVPDKHFRGDLHLHKARTLPYLPLLNLNNSSSEDFISVADECANLNKSKEKLSEILVSSNEADLVSNNLKNSTGTKEKSINTKLSNSADVEEFIEEEGIRNQADRECAILNVPDNKHSKEDSLVHKAQTLPNEPLNNMNNSSNELVIISVADECANFDKPKDKISEILVSSDDADSNSNNSSGTHEDSMKTDLSNFIDVDEFIKEKGITNQAEKECSILDVPDKHFRGDLHLHKARTLPYLPLLNLNNSSSEDFISVADECANLNKSKEKLSEILVSSNEADLVSNNLKSSTGTKEKSINTKLSNFVDVEEFIEEEGIRNQADRECAILNVPDNKHSKEDSLVHKAQTLPNEPLNNLNNSSNELVMISVADECANLDKPNDKISEILVSSDDSDSNSNNLLNSSGPKEDSTNTDFSNFIDVEEFTKENGIPNQAEKECAISDVPDKHSKEDSLLHKVQTLPHEPLNNLNNSSSELVMISVADECANLDEPKEKLSEIVDLSDDADLISNLENSTGANEESMTEDLSNFVEVEEFMIEKGIKNQPESHQNNIKEKGSDADTDFNNVDIEELYKVAKHLKQELLAPDNLPEQSVELKEPTIVNTEIASDDKPTIFCEACGASCQNDVELDSHTAKNHKETYFECSVCDRFLFKSVSELIAHQDEKHKKSTLAHAEYYSFMKYSKELADHFRYYCKHCGTGFNLIHEISRHMISNCSKANRDKNNTCDKSRETDSFPTYTHINERKDCNESFKKAHTKNSPTCMFCGEKFGYWYLLNEHRAAGCTARTTPGAQSSSSNDVVKVDEVRPEADMPEAVLPKAEIPKAFILEAVKPEIAIPVKSSKATKTNINPKHPSTSKPIRCSVCPKKFFINIAALESHSKFSRKHIELLNAMNSKKPFVFKRKRGKLTAHVLITQRSSLELGLDIQKSHKGPVVQAPNPPTPIIDLNMDPQKQCHTHIAQGSSKTEANIEVGLLNEKIHGGLKGQDSKPSTFNSYPKPNQKSQVQGSGNPDIDVGLLIQKLHDAIKSRKSKKSTSNSYPKLDPQKSKQVIKRLKTKKPKVSKKKRGKHTAYVLNPLKSSLDMSLNDQKSHRRPVVVRDPNPPTPIIDLNMDLQKQCHEHIARGSSNPGTDIKVGLPIEKIHGGIKGQDSKPSTSNSYRKPNLQKLQDQGSSNPEPDKDEGLLIQKLHDDINSQDSKPSTSNSYPKLDLQISQAQGSSNPELDLDVGLLIQKLHDDINSQDSKPSTSNSYPKLDLQKSQVQGSRNPESNMDVSLLLQRTHGGVMDHDTKPSTSNLYSKLDPQKLRSQHIVRDTNQLKLTVDLDLDVQIKKVRKVKPFPRRELSRSPPRSRRRTPSSDSRRRSIERELMLKEFEEVTNKKILNDDNSKSPEKKILNDDNSKSPESRQVEERGAKKKKKPSHTCNICGQTFINYIMLIEHYNICIFKSEDSSHDRRLAKAIKKKEVPKNNVHTCSTCGQMFINLHMLVRHNDVCRTAPRTQGIETTQNKPEESIHDSGNSKPIKKKKVTKRILPTCNVCAKTFSQWFLLIQHRAVGCSVQSTQVPNVESVEDKPQKTLDVETSSQVQEECAASSHESKIENDLDETKSTDRNDKVENHEMELENDLVSQVCKRKQCSNF